MTKSARGYIREPGTGTGVNAVTVSAKLHNGGTTVTSDATDTNGLFEIDHDTLGYPGPIYLTATDSGTTTVLSGNVTGQIAGLYYPADLPDVIQALGIGVLPGFGSDLECSADGTDMNVDVAAGIAILKDGLPYVLDAASSVTLDAADGSNPRIDRIVLRLTREGQTDQGKIALTKITGTPAGSPAAPALTQTSATWDLSLAQVLVGTGVSVIAADKVTDERTYAFAMPASVAAGDLLYINSSTQVDNLAVGTSSQVLIGGSAPSWGSVPADALPSGIDAAKLADGSVSNTEFQYVNGVTSAIQTQLDGKVADTGDTMTGALVIAKTSTGALDIANDSSATTYFSFDTSGGILDLLEGADLKIWAGPGTTNNKLFIDGATGNTTLGGTLGTASAITITSGNLVLTSGRVTGQPGGINVVIGNGVDAITTSTPTPLIHVPYAITITGWYIYSDVTGSIVVDVWNDSYANHPATNADSIAGTEKPTLSSARKNSDTSLSSWTTSVAADSHLMFEIESVSTVKQVTVVLKYKTA